LSHAVVDVLTAGATGYRSSDDREFELDFTFASPRRRGAQTPPPGDPEAGWRAPKQNAALLGQKYRADSTDRARKRRACTASGPRTAL